ncbi:hypothetical protein DIPPA_63031 [Diplonema papillatum]|nr:hypothetical protein DIPPA_63031 [Diplonema papillatum]
MAGPAGAEGDGDIKFASLKFDLTVTRIVSVPRQSRKPCLTKRFRLTSLRHPQPAVRHLVLVGAIERTMLSVGLLFTSSTVYLANVSVDL